MLPPGSAKASHESFLDGILGTHHDDGDSRGDLPRCCGCKGAYGHDNANPALDEPQGALSDPFYANTDRA
jgi:hypothetical protein